MSEAKTYVFGQDSNSALATVLPLLQQRGIDPSYLMGMMGNNNGGFFGNNALEGIIALIVVAAIFGNGNFGFGGFGGNNVASTAERDLLAHMIQRNGTDLSQLAQSINCSTGRLDDAIQGVATQLCNLASQNGMSFQQVINAVQSNNSALATQLCNCCCEIRTAIADSKYATERGFCDTNAAITRGFSDVGYAFRDQTCNLEKAIAASTAQILEGQRAAEMRDLQDKLDALREKNSQQAVILNNAQQTSQFAAMLAPIQADLAELKCNQVPVKKIACPETYVPVNNSINATYGLIPTHCGFGAFGAGFGFPNGWNGWNGGSLWG